MALSDMYEILDRQIRVGEPILNVYHAVKIDAGANATTIATAFDESVLPAVTLLQVAALSHTLIEVRNLDSPTDFTTRVPTNNVGLRTGEGLATFDAVSLLFNRTRTDIRNGQKRFDGGQETDITNNTWLTTFTDQVQLAGDAIVGPWELDAVPGIIQCRFVIIKRVCTVQPPPTPCPGYRLPVTDAELVFYQPLTSQAATLVRSQVSRKQLV